MVFAGGSIAERYDEVLVPIMFGPWAETLLAKLPPEAGWDILDLATGTGIVASRIAPRLGRDGSLVAADLSADMLAMARARVGAVGAKTRVDFVESSAHPLELADEAFDAIYCQQGFQFFPESSVPRPGSPASGTYRAR
jgi:ubiquinone/menaquinone biosynthesis C-methylase UbiE